MINGLFLDPRIWALDYTTSPFWTPNAFGVNIDLHKDAFRIPSLGVVSKYKFVLASEVWEIPMQKTLNYLRGKGLRVFLVPREILPAQSHLGIMFCEEKFKYKDNYFFKPDAIFAPSIFYANLWRQQGILTEIIGYPRFDVYLPKDKWANKNFLIQKFGLEKQKKILFFPSYPPYSVQTVNGKSVMADLAEDLQNTMRILEKIADLRDDLQVVVKIHPMAQKCYDKKIGSGTDVTGLLEYYYKHPSKKMKVIGDTRMSSQTARELMILADYVIGHASVMMLEAVLLDKPVLSARLEQSKELKGALDYSKYMKTVYSCAELETSLSGLLNSPKDFLIKDKEIINQYLFKVDGKFCERLCFNIKKYI